MVYRLLLIFCVASLSCYSQDEDFVGKYKAYSYRYKSPRLDSIMDVDILIVVKKMRVIIYSYEKQTIDAIKIITSFNLEGKLSHVKCSVYDAVDTFGGECELAFYEDTEKEDEDKLYMITIVYPDAKKEYFYKVRLTD